MCLCHGAGKSTIDTLAAFFLVHLGVYCLHLGVGLPLRSGLGPALGPALARRLDLGYLTLGGAGGGGGLLVQPLATTIGRVILFLASSSEVLSNGPAILIISVAPSFLALLFSVADLVLLDDDN